MMKKYILIMLLALAGLAGMAQTNEPLPSGAVQFSNQLWLNPADSTIWTGDAFEGKYVNLGSWHKVDSLLALKADAADLADYYTQSQIDAFLALKADESALDDFYTKLEVDGLLAGYVPTSRTVNGKALTGNITLNANDVNALQAGDNVSDLVNDVPYLTSGDIPAPPVTSVNSMTGAVVIAKADIGLGNVDNTSDANKPISTATQGALDLKEDKSNKVTSLSTPNNTTYPTTQAVKTAIDAIEPPDVTGSNGIQVDDGDISPVYGTAAGTVAQGNDSRINNGQTAYGWGDYRQFGLGATVTSNVSNWTSYSPVENRFIGDPSRSTTGKPSGYTGYALGLNLQRSLNIASQIVVDTRTGTLATRGIDGSGWTDWRLYWHTGNFNPSDYIPASDKASANGVASLDGSGKVPTSQLPTTGMQYKGTWNASTNTPTLSDGTGTEGYFYRVTTAGTQNLGSGSIAFSVGDDVIHNGSVWQRAPSGATSTNLALGSRTSTTMPITNSNGTGVTLPARTASLAGLMTPTDLSTLNSALQSESDPTVPSQVKSITSGDITNWNTAYSDYFSVSATQPNNMSSHSRDWNSVDGAGAWVMTGASDNPPISGNSAEWALINLYRSASQSAQIAMGVSGAGYQTGLWYRHRQSDAWNRVWDSNNFNPSDYLTTANFTWANLTGKPSTFTPSAHTHNASDITSGTLAIGRIPTGTTGSTVALGNHTHTASAITSGTFNIARIPTGTSSSTVAIGNDSRINNGQTAYGWGNHASAGYAVIGTSGGQVRTNTQLDARYLQSSDLSGYVPTSRTINGKALSANVTLTNADIGSEPAFSKNTAFNKNFGTTSGTVAQGNDSRIVNAVPNTRTINGKALSANVTLSASDVSAMPTSWTITAGNGLTGGGTGAANRTLAVGAGDGIAVASTTVGVDATVARRNAANTFSGANTFSQPVVGQDATAPNHLVTRQQVPSIAANEAGLYRLEYAAPSAIFNGGSGNRLKRGTTSTVWSHTVPAGTFTGGGSSNAAIEIELYGSISKSTTSPYDIDLVMVGTGGEMRIPVLRRGNSTFTGAFRAKTIGTYRQTSGLFSFSTENTISDNTSGGANNTYIYQNSQSGDIIDMRETFTMYLEATNQTVGISIIPLTVKVANINSI